MGVVRNCNHVVVTRSCVVFSVHGRCGVHSSANLRHRVVFKICFVLLIIENLADALSCLGVELTSLFVISFEKAVSGQSNKKLAVSC